LKLWQKDKASLKEVEKFTVGNDRDLDIYLAPFDVLGSLAHTKMLESVGLLTKDELIVLEVALKEIYQQISKGNFQLDEGVEDIHSQVELMLTHKLGDTGKKIHSARSRNDQVLVDLKLFLRSEIEKLVHSTKEFFDLLILQSEKYRADLLPGYTHLQLAMPSLHPSRISFVACLLPRPHREYSRRVQPWMTTVMRCSWTRDMLVEHRSGIVFREQSKPSQNPRITMLQ